MQVSGENSGEGAVSIDIEDPLNHMKKQLAKIDREGNASRLITICRVPQSIRQVNVAAYTPTMFSIGPYHHPNQNLQANQDLKWRYLHSFLSRNPDISLDDCFRKMKSSEDLTRSCYWGSIDMGSDEFVQMMVLDGCFIVEILLKQMKECALDLRGTLDPIYRTQWLLPLIARDMLLLENQIPFFILEQLYDLVEKSNPETLSDMAIEFMDHVIPRNDKIRPTKNIHHLLHLFHTRLLPDSKANKRAKRLDVAHSIISVISILHKPPPPLYTIPTAVELQNLGVRFAVKETMGSFLNAEFENGQMKIPHFSVHDNTESLFRNFIAFEQCFPEYESHFTSYAVFMDSLVNTVNDVAILTHNGIMEHGLGSEEEVARLFNDLRKGVAFDPKGSYLNGLFMKVKNYASEPWHKWRASLVRDYFRNPWAILSLIGALFIIVLTVVQTYMTLYAYYTPPS